MNPFSNCIYLFNSIFLGHTRIAKLLADNSANLDWKNSHGKTAISILREKGNASSFSTINKVN